MKVVVSGASGVLGSAVYNAFKKAGHDVVGLALSRASSSLKRVDLLDKDALSDLVREQKPNWFIHCAAERRPDVAEKDPEKTRKLNVEVPRHLAELSVAHGFTLVYISTDYVFDGQNPPYEVDSQTNPLQFYGVTKRDGENAILNVIGVHPVVLRVPVLYGPAPKNSDTAINILVDVVQDQSGKTYKMDHFATRYPTNVLDIASFLFRLAAFAGHIPKILHYSAPDPYTKYEMCLVFSAILSLPHKHIIPDSQPPPPDVAVGRPRDCHLSVKAIEELGLEVDSCDFEEWWRGYLAK